jgi:hypothetical protein
MHARDIMLPILLLALPVEGKCHLSLFEPPFLLGLLLTMPAHWNKNLQNRDYF